MASLFVLHQNCFLLEITEVTMKKVSLAVLIALLPATGTVFAQGAASGGITESVDPARAAAVEQRAKEIQEAQQAQQSGASQQGTAASSDATDKKPQKRSPAKKRSEKSKEHGTSGSSDAGDKASK
jgi:hypothetical protein